MAKLTDEQIIERKKRREKIFEHIQAECVSQDVKWGDQSHTDAEWLQILTEELGEHAKASMDSDPVNARRELRQSTAVMIQWLFDMMRRPYDSKTMR